MEESNETKILQSFPPILRPLIQKLYLEKIGLCSKNVELMDLTSSQSLSNSNDQFCVGIPYAGQKIFWNIYFHYSDYSFAPDFDFDCTGTSDFMIDPELSEIEEHVPSLGNWDYKNENSLFDVLREFLDLFRRHQVSLLDCEKLARLCAEYQLLTGDLIKPENVEVLVDGELVHFLILLHIDIACLPEYAQPKDANVEYNPCETTATLRVTFIKPDASRTKVDVYLSPRLDQIIGPSNKLHIPAYPKQSGLLDYVPIISGLLNDKLEILAKHYRLKNEYISTLVNMYTKEVLEYDNFEFTRCVLLLDTDTTSFLVSVSLNNKFPEEKPKITLKAVQNLLSKLSTTHSDSGKLNTHALDNYPYSPRWNPKQMIERAMGEVEKVKKPWLD